MEFLIGFIAIIGIYVLVKILRATAPIDDPHEMTDQVLISSIAGQADWLEKMSRSPIDSQKSPSIIALTRKRREHMANMCLEVISRGKKIDSTFQSTTDASNEISISTGKNATYSAVEAVKNHLFKNAGITHYRTSWHN